MPATLKERRDALLLAATALDHLHLCITSRDPATTIQIARDRADTAVRDARRLGISHTDINNARYT